MTICSRRSIALLLAFFLFGPSFPALSYSEEAIVISQQNSPQPKQLWEELLSLTSSLPGNFDNFVATLEMRIGLLSDSNKQLLTSNQELKVSNESLTESNKKLEKRAETSENKSTQLQTDLDASILSTTRAQEEAKRLEIKLAFFKIGFFTVGIGAVVLGSYEAGRYFKLWK